MAKWEFCPKCGARGKNGDYDHFPWCPDFVRFFRRWTW